MAHKILVLIAALTVAAGGAAFASGQKDAAPDWGPATTGPKLTLAGPVTFTNLVHPTLKSGDTTYELLVPRMLVVQAGLQDGAKITVEGYKATGLPTWDTPPAGTVAVVVTKATIDGKDYDLSQLDRPGYGGRGMRGGMMGGGSWGGPGGQGGGYGRGPMGRGWTS